MFVIAIEEEAKKKIGKASILGAIRRVSEFPEVEENSANVFDVSDWKGDWDKWDDWDQWQDSHRK